MTAAKSSHTSMLECHDPFSTTISTNACNWLIVAFQRDANQVRSDLFSDIGGFVVAGGADPPLWSST